MNFRKKKIAVVLAVVVALSAGVLASRSELMTGRFGFMKQTSKLQNPQLGYPSYTAEQIQQILRTSHFFRNLQGRPVSGVTTPVPSVVASEVPSSVSSRVSSSGGVSRVSSWVSSQVPSVLVSAVSSAVPLPDPIASQIRPSDLPALSGAALQALARQEKLINPNRFVLSNEARTRMIQLYKFAYPKKK